MAAFTLAQDGVGAKQRPLADPRWRLAAGVATEAAVADYVKTSLPLEPDERTVLTTGPLDDE